MRNWRNEIGSYVIITTVSVLIWLWAAGETREQKTVISKAQFVVPDTGEWIIDPDLHAFNMVVEGSRLSIQNVETLARNGFVINISPEVGEQTVDIEAALKANTQFRETGATLVSIDRPAATPTVDRLVTVQIPVKPNLPGVQTMDQPRVEPAMASLTLPSRLQARTNDIRVQAFMGQDQTSLLPAGILQQLDVRPRLLPESLASNEYVSFSPSEVRLSFTIRSQTREYKLDRPVKVQLAGPWEDQRDYLVELETDSLRDVTVVADADLVRRIESGEAAVVAVVYLQSIEKERYATDGSTVEKPVSYFMAMAGDAGYPIRVKINGSDQPPMVKLKVTALAKQPPAD